MTSGRKIRWNPWLLIFLAAALGGMAPTLVKQARIIADGGPLPSPSILVALIIYLALGGCIALIFKETDLKKAFFLGIGVPALIVSGQGGGQVGFGDNIKGAMYFLSPTTALAQEGKEEKVEEQKKLVIVSEMTCDKCFIRFYSKDGELVAVLRFPKAPGTHEFPVPRNVSAFGIWNSAITPQLWKLKEPTKYVFGYEFKPWNDFWRGLGNDTIRSYDSIVTPLSLGNRS